VSNWVTDESHIVLRRTAQELRKRMGDIAAAIAATEEDVADTFDRLAHDRPHDQQRLQERAASARLVAVQARDLAARCGNPSSPPRNSGTAPAEEG
jgi:thiamine monophosphate kinase